MRHLSEIQNKQVDLKLMQGAVDRASLMSLFYAVAFPIYGLTNYEFMVEVDPSISLWDNFWPRLVFNGIPFAIFYFLFRKFKSNTELKLWLWTLGYPLILTAANSINVWPLMLHGHPQIYLHVHGACFIATIMALSWVAPPPKFLWSMVGMTVLIFIVPLSGIFIHLEKYPLLRFMLNDASYSFFLAVLSAKTSFRLRQSLATEDVLNQERIGKFLGNLVSQSIFEQDESLLQSRFSHGFLLSLDVRGFTMLMQNMDPAVASRFKESYHRIVARVVGEMGGFIHKTHGDGHLISLGLMNTEVLSPETVGTDGDVEIASARKHGEQLQQAITIFEKVFEQFEILKKELMVEHKVCVCASIDYGEIGLNILGDPNVRLEFDIEGMVVIRCARLEAFTKTLREVLASDSSFLIVSSSACSYLLGDRSFQIFKTTQHPIRDFPNESFVAYREYNSQNISKREVA